PPRIQAAARIPDQPESASREAGVSGTQRRERRDSRLPGSLDLLVLLGQAKRTPQLKAIKNTPRSKSRRRRFAECVIVSHQSWASPSPLGFLGFARDDEERDRARNDENGDGTSTTRRQHPRPALPKRGPAEMLLDRQSGRPHRA